MTHASRFPARMTHLQPAAVVLDGGRFVPAVSCDRSWTAASVAGFSIATTASLSAGTPRCSSAPSDVLAETSFRIPSTDILGFAAAAIAASCLACYPVVDSVVELLDLDRGSWEVLRGALFQAPGFLLFQVDGKAKRGEPSVPVLL
jgi:hypothetical protein